MSNSNNWVSVKTETDTPFFNPCSYEQVYGDRKVTMSNPNPPPGQEPSAEGYYLGYFEPTLKPGSDKKVSKIHKFQDAKGDLFNMWGSYDLDKQLDIIKRKQGLGIYCLMQWNGRKVTSKKKDLPKEALKDNDYYHDWTVSFNPNIPSIKVDSDDQQYKSTPVNQAVQHTATMYAPQAPTGTPQQFQPTPNTYGAQPTPVVPVNNPGYMPPVGNPQMPQNNYPAQLPNQLPPNNAVPPPVNHQGYAQPVSNPYINQQQPTPQQQPVTPYGMPQGNIPVGAQQQNFNPGTPQQPVDWSSSAALSDDTPF